jgi:two-component system cell cycle response regulator DivK
VVEDNHLNMKLFNGLLELGGYNVLQAKNGMEGWRMARERRPDLILMDIQLPGVSGLEVTKWLKDDENLIEKPISLSDFLETVERFAGPPVAEREAV